MSIEVTGPWILLAVGAFMLIVATLSSFRKGPPKGRWISIIGLATCGVGVYGPVFLIPYGKFISPLLQMQQSPDAQTYEQAFEAVARGDLPSEYQELALAYALDRPIDGMDQLLAQAVDHAQNPGGKKALREARASLRGKMQAASKLASSMVTPTGVVDDEAARRIAEFDPAMRALIARPLLKLSDERLGGLNRRALESFAAPRELRARRAD